MPGIPSFLVPLLTIADSVIVITVLAGIWLALRRTALPPPARTKTFATVAALLLVWLGGIYQLSRASIFVASGDGIAPLIVLPIILPVLIGGLLLIRSQLAAAIVDATPHSWLIGVQFFRVLGGVFLVLLAQGLLPGVFALPAGIGDVLVGVLALAVVRLFLVRHSRARLAARIWNLFGIADLVLAVVTGFLSSPGPFQQLALGNPNQLISMYPLVMIPAFAVPLFLLLHMLSLWKFHREAAMDQKGWSQALSSGGP